METTLAMRLYGEIKFTRHGSPCKGGPGAWGTRVQAESLLMGVTNVMHY